MPLPKKDKFLDEVLYYIKFPFDRENIKHELECHILEKIDYYTEQGYDKVAAEQLSINDMGEAKEIGIELNKQHNPLLGWLWKITNVMVILFVVLNIYIIGALFLSSLTNNPINDISKSNIVYKVDIDEKVKLDDAVIHFTNVIYENNGNLSIFYKYYDTNLWGAGWSSSEIGIISDNLGNVYFAGSGGGGGGIISRYRRTVENFSNEAETLIISYDSYNRKYRIEIPLQVGDNNE